MLQKNVKDDLNVSLEKLEGTLLGNKKQLKRLSARENYWREKCSKLENDDDKIYTQDDVDTLRVKIEQLTNESRQNQEQIHNMYVEINSLEAHVNHLSKLENAVVYDEISRTYDHSLHLCVYSLLDHNVAYENIDPVIKSVLKLVNKELNKLPSVGTIHNWSIERGLISKRQIAETSSNTNTTLHTDEASKYGQKWGAFGTRDTEGNYTLLGLSEMATKSSHDTLDTF